MGDSFRSGYGRYDDMPSGDGGASQDELARYFARRAAARKRKHARAMRRLRARELDARETFHQISARD